MQRTGRLPDPRHFLRAVHRDVERARRRDTGAAGVWRHAADAAAAEALIRWQILQEPWSTVAANLPDFRSIDAVRDLVFRAARALSFTPRRAGRGRTPLVPHDPKGSPRAPGNGAPYSVAPQDIESARYLAESLGAEVAA
jgi:hypothetical protein